MNHVVLIGRLTKDVELSYTANTQTASARFTIAVDRPKRNGQDQGADFIRITVWGRQAENCNRYLGKGRQVAVHGRIQTGSYKNSKGDTVYTTDVVADSVEFLGNNQVSNHSGNDAFGDPSNPNLPPAMQQQQMGSFPQGNPNAAQTYNTQAVMPQGGTQMGFSDYTYDEDEPF